MPLCAVQVPSGSIEVENPSNQMTVHLARVGTHPKNDSSKKYEFKESKYIRNLTIA